MKEEANKFNNITKEETTKAGSKNFILRLWQDSVFSQLIATGILVSLPIITAIIVKFLDGKSIGDFFINFLRLDIKLYILILITLTILGIYFIYLKFFQNRKKSEKHYLTQIVGNYRFGDLNNILLTSYIELPKDIQDEVGLKELDLLTAFRIFIAQFNFGIGWNHPTDEGAFLYYSLGPTLMSFGLCEKVPSIDTTEENINPYIIQTSESGYKFFALLESYNRIFNMKSYEKEFKEKQKIKDEILEKKTRVK